MKTVPATIAHAAGIYPRLRVHDAVRLYAITNGNPVGALQDLIARSAIDWCGVNEADDPVTLGGVVNVGHETGYVWQVTAADLSDHKRDYIKQGKQMMAVGMGEFARLETRIAADYPQALRHTRRFGWKVGPVDASLGVPSHLCVRNR